MVEHAASTRECITGTRLHDPLHFLSSASVISRKCKHCSARVQVRGRARRRHRVLATSTQVSIHSLPSDVALCSTNAHPLPSKLLPRVGTTKGGGRTVKLARDMHRLLLDCALPAAPVLHPCARVCRRRRPLQLLVGVFDAFVLGHHMARAAKHPLGGQQALNAHGAARMDAAGANANLQGHTQGESGMR